MANSRCRVHGGAAPKGPAHWNWRGGRYATYMPAGMTEAYTAAVADADRMGMADEVALVDALSAAALGRMNGAGSPDWLALAAALADFDAAQARGRLGLPAMHAALDRLRALVAAGATGASARAELRALIDQRRLLVESEARRETTRGRVVPVEQVMGMLAALATMVADEVSDPSERTRVVERLVAMSTARRLSLGHGGLA